MGKGLERTLELDARLVEVAGKVKVLSSLAWDEAECARFLEGWRKGKPKLPAPELAPTKVGTAVEELTAIALACDFEDPLSAYVGRTARSYAMAAPMLFSFSLPYRSEALSIAAAVVFTASSGARSRTRWLNGSAVTGPS